MAVHAVLLVSVPVNVERGRWSSILTSVQVLPEPDVRVTVVVVVWVDGMSRTLCVEDASDAEIVAVKVILHVVVPSFSLTESCGVFSFAENGESVIKSPVDVIKNVIVVAVPIPPCVVPVAVHFDWNIVVFCHMVGPDAMFMSVFAQAIEFVPAVVWKLNAGVTLIPTVVAPAVPAPSAARPPTGTNIATAMPAARRIRDFMVLSLLVVYPWISGVSMGAVGGAQRGRKRHNAYDQLSIYGGRVQGKIKSFMLKCWKISVPHRKNGVMVRVAHIELPFSSCGLDE